MSSLNELPHAPVAEHLRIFYRHKDTGELAYLVQVDGRPRLRMNRPGEVLLRKFDQDVWIPDDTARTLAPMQKAQVSFEADKQLCRVLGLVTEAKRDWTRLRDTERIEWLRRGPRDTDDPTVSAVRHALWAGIETVLARLS